MSPLRFATTACLPRRLPTASSLCATRRGRLRTADLVAQVRVALGGRRAASVGFVTHDHGAGRFYLCGEHSICLASTLADGEERAFWRELGELIEPGGRIDIFACDLAATDEGRMLVAALADAAGVDVAASSNSTGNQAFGGDWVLESAGIDIAGDLFRLVRATEIHRRARFLRTESDGFGCCFQWLFRLLGFDGWRLGNCRSAWCVRRLYVPPLEWDLEPAGQVDALRWCCRIRQLSVNRRRLRHRRGVIRELKYPALHISSTTRVESGTSRAKLTDSGGQSGDHFGDSVSISGDYAIVGAPDDNENGDEK